MRLAFWVSGLQECQKNPPPKTPSTTICKIAPQLLWLPSSFLCGTYKSKTSTLKSSVNIHCSKQ